MNGTHSSGKLANYKILHCINVFQMRTKLKKRERRDRNYAGKIANDNILQMRTNAIRLRRCGRDGMYDRNVAKDKSIVKHAYTADGDQCYKGNRRDKSYAEKVVNDKSIV